MKKNLLALFAFLFIASTNLLATNYVVSGAGTAAVNGTYEESGTYNGKPKYVLSGTDYQLKYNDFWDDRWEIWDDGNWEIMYYTDVAGDTPPATGWYSDYGANPAPSVVLEGPALSYSSARFIESDDNDGTIKTTITITHNNFGGATFTGNVNDVYNAAKVVVTNIPAGLSSNMVLKSSTEIEFTLTGTATAHANANDIANLTVTFQDAAFSGGSASAVSNSTKSDLIVEFIEFLNVPASYGTITAAINAAEDYDIILIAAGTYTEAGITVNKTLTFKGEAANTTIVQAAASYNTASTRVFNINTSGVTVRFYDLTIRYGKTTSAGAGIYATAQHASLEIYRCSIRDNVSGDLGGGIYAWAMYEYYVIIENSLIHNNTAARNSGGALLASSGIPVIIKNTTISSNTSNGSVGGGGINGNFNLINCTITGNTANGATNGGGGVHLSGNSNIQNTIIYGNTCATGGADLFRLGGTTNAYSSIINATAASSGVAINGTSSNVSSANPLLSALADNGGPTYTCALQAGSPAIDAGMTGDEIPTTDQRGYYANGTRDIGAYEYNGSATLSSPMQLVFTTTAANQYIQLPLYGTVDCTVNWGDGSATEDFTTTGDKEHTFSTAGTYTVEISGTLTQFGKTSSSIWNGVSYLTAVNSFGDIGLTSLQYAFMSADNLASVPTELPATITSLAGTFSELNRVSINNLDSWDVSHVTNMYKIFNGTDNFNQNIGGWDVISVTNMGYMFSNANAFNQNIGNWNVGNVTNMDKLFNMANSFNQPIGSWNVENVTSMNFMFYSADAFNQNIGGWDVGNVTSMMATFAGASAFNQDISGWDVSSVTTMYGTFYGATSFDQNLGSWNITSVTDMSDMFGEVTLSTANYDALLTGWATQSVQSGVTFGGGNSKYSAGAAATARGVLTGAPNSWVITDGGINSLTYTWDGSTDSDWNTAANWDLNAVPTASDNAVIANAGIPPVISYSDAITCNQLTVNSGASLTIEDGGSLIANSATGTVTVQRFLNGISQYHFLSSPINNADLATIFDESLQGEVYLRRFDEPSGNWVHLEIPATLTNGVGYSYIWQSKAMGTTATFTGSLITSDLSPTITNAGTTGANYIGYNLLGNPFTSAIQWGTGNWNRNNVDNAVYVWNDGVYVSYVNGLGDLEDGIIPAQQGFFVKANAASPSITIPAAARVHDDQSFYKSVIPNVLRLDVANNVNEYADATFIHFTPEATPLFDSQFDAYKLQNDPEAPMIYTHAGDVTLSINSLPAIEDYNEIPVSFTAGVDGRYTLTASGMETFANGNIVLTDLATNATQNLSQNPVYSFDATTSDQPDRFKVSFATVGINDNPLQYIGVYASNGFIVLQLPQATKAEVTIANLAGQVTARQSINATGNVTINAPCTTGVYLVTLTTDEGTITRKVIVN